MPVLKYFILCLCTLGLTHVYALQSYTELGDITEKRLDEISGIIPAQSFAGFWVHNDSGDAARLYAIAPDGRYIGMIRLEGVAAVDWEDIASYTTSGQRRICLADIGDNYSLRPQVQLYLFKEPERPDATMTVDDIKVITFTYPNGPRDAEGIAVDPANAEILILSKRTVPPQLFSVPLSATTAPITATLLTDVRLPTPHQTNTQKKKRHAAKVDQPTAMDYDASTRTLLISTSRRAFLYHKGQTEDWASCLRKQPQEVTIPKLKQAEASCLTSTAVILTTERLPAPLISAPRP